jgi:hypothetical protein
MRDDPKRKVIPKTESLQEEGVYLYIQVINLSSKMASLIKGYFHTVIASQAIYCFISLNMMASMVQSTYQFSAYLLR